jgi:predicted enzyme related to lactoylglutathione lyase
MARPVHFEILAHDPAKLRQFYSQVFGWSAQHWGGEEQYWLLSTGEEGTPGINGAIMGRHFDQAVINTIEVESLDETMAKVTGAGGKVINEPNEIPGVGTHVYCQDPDGNLFGMMQSAPEME